jgi:hypothetical protein
MMNRKELIAITDMRVVTQAAMEAGNMVQL